MADEILDELEVPEEVQEEEVQEEVQEEEEEEVQEEEEVEEEAEEEPEEEEEEEEKLPSQYHRSSFKEIKEKYPTFFKDFPDMREVYFREREFTNLFPTVEDAQESLNQAQAFVSLEKELLSGSTKGLLDALESVNKSSVVKVAESFLPQIYQKSPDLYFQVINPILESFVRNVFEEGEKANNENYKAAAMYVAQFAWGHTNMQNLGQKKSQSTSNPEIEQERQKLAQEREQIANQKYQEVHGHVAGRGQKLLLNEIVKLVPVDKFENKYVRDSMIRDIYSKMNEVLTEDPAHMRLMNSLWQKAAKEGFSPESRNRLVTTFLARAKRILPAVRKEIVSQLGGKKIGNQPKPIGGKAAPKSSTSSSSNSGGKKVDYSQFNSDRALMDALVDKKG